MPKVTLKTGESVRDALFRLRKVTEREGMQDQLTGKNYYVKPSEKRKLTEEKRLQTIHLAQKNWRFK